MSVSTKDIPTGGGGIPKTLQPGNQICKINSIQLVPFTFKEGAVHLVLNMEGKNLGDDYLGFFLDKDDESKGRYKGQVGRVNSYEWAYCDGETKSGIPVSRDTEILKFLKSLCDALELTWLADADGKYETVDALVEGFNNDKPFADRWLNCCLAGKEYDNKDGYTNYNLFFPKFSKKGVPFESLATANSKLLTFDEEQHIVKKKVKAVDEFEATPATPTNDFNLDTTEAPKSENSDLPF